MVEEYGEFDASESQGWRDALDPFGAGESDPADVFDAERLRVVGRGGRRRRRARDDAVDALDKITAQMSGGEHRPEQQEMCRAVAEALVTRTHLAVQAGSGTGKSVAYLVPAALSGKNVVVATATKAPPRAEPVTGRGHP